MDKYEYKVRAEEIKTLIVQGDYAQAAEIADTIDWRRVKSVMMLCTVSDVYKINRRLEDARDMLLMAYDRHPEGRTIVYSLCELSIKMGEFLQAVEYYKQFVQIAPRDTGRYILQYKLYEAQDVGLEERIEVLEELKKRDYREKWAYELAYLYHRVGLATRCVEECDELILWFGEGKYVIKAMELKMLHQALTPDQQQRYDSRFLMREEPVYEQEEEEPLLDAGEAELKVYAGESGQETYTGEIGQEIYYGESGQEAYTGELDQEVYYGESGQDPYYAQEPQGAYYEDGAEEAQEGYYTEGAQDTYYGEETQGDYLPEEAQGMYAEETDQEAYYGQEPQGAYYEDDAEEAQEGYYAEEASSVIAFPGTEKSGEDELDIQVKTMDVSQFNTINLEKELAEGLKEVLSEEEKQPVQQEQAVLAAKEDEAQQEIHGESDDETQVQVSESLTEPALEENPVTGQLAAADILEEWTRVRIEQEERIRILVEELRKKNEELEAISSRQNQEEEKLKEARACLEAENCEEITEDTCQEAEPGQEEVSEYPEATEALEETEAVQDEAVLYAEDEVCVEETESEESDLEEIEDAENDIEVTEGTENDISRELSEEEPLAEEAARESSQPMEAVGSEEAVKATEYKKPHIRSWTKEERELFGSFIQNKKARESLITALDKISMASFTGNLIVTGDEGMDTMTFARNILRQIQLTDSNFTGKTAKISGQMLNSKDVTAVLEGLKGGALIIQKASAMNQETAEKLCQELHRETLGIIVVLEDSKKGMKKLLSACEKLEEYFTARIDLEALSNEALVAFGKKYARERECSFDELGVLALHTRIEDMQTIDHAVNVLEVKEIIDEAIRRANRKTPRHFLDVLLAKRYDDEDLMILREDDFV